MAIFLARRHSSVALPLISRFSIAAARLGAAPLARLAVAGTAATATKPPRCRDHDGYSERG